MVMVIFVIEAPTISIANVLVKVVTINETEDFLAFFPWTVVIINKFEDFLAYFPWKIAQRAKSFPTLVVHLSCIREPDPSFFSNCNSFRLTAVEGSTSSTTFAAAWAVIKHSIGTIARGAILVGVWVPVEVWQGRNVSVPHCGILFELC